MRVRPAFMDRLGDLNALPDPRHTDLCRTESVRRAHALSVRVRVGRGDDN